MAKPGTRILRQAKIRQTCDRTLEPERTHMMAPTRKRVKDIADRVRR
jgi:hypothetical protein